MKCFITSVDIFAIAFIFIVRNDQLEKSITNKSGQNNRIFHGIWENDKKFQQALPRESTGFENEWFTIGMTGSVSETDHYSSELMFFELFPSVGFIKPKNVGSPQEIDIQEVDLQKMNIYSSDMERNSHLTLLGKEIDNNMNELFE